MMVYNNKGIHSEVTNIMKSNYIKFPNSVLNAPNTDNPESTIFES
jgi:hypothetical protein